MLRGLYATVVLAIATSALGIPAIAISLLKRGSDATMRLGKLWSRIMLSAVGARVTYEGLDHCRAHMPCIYIANHQSNVDIWALIRALPPPTRFVAKESIFRIPVLGWAMATAGFVPIDRSNRSRAVRSLMVAAERVRSGRPVVLFPEGTRSTTGSLLPFKKGPFHLALQAGVPVVPIAISGSGRILPRRSLRVTPGPVLVRFLPAIEVTEFLPDDHGGLLEKVRGALLQALEE
jgi:1-acyl-sn-glycerol-3-phosphate acyltransferase